MTERFSYEEYVTDDEFLRDYNAYQARYAEDMRESDKVLVATIRRLLAGMPASAQRRALLDIGCSTGNLLLHLRRLMPDLDLFGGDLAESSLAECRANPHLHGVKFDHLDLLNLPSNSPYDFVVVNAVLYMMTDDEFLQAVRSLAGAVAPGGAFVAFDFFHSFDQDISILETSKTHPNGLRLRFRKMQSVSRMLQEHGFLDVRFQPFTLPMDLPMHPDPSELITYTITASDGRRLPFRGALFQPWCHLTAERRS